MPLILPPDVTAETLYEDSEFCGGKPLCLGIRDWHADLGAPSGLAKAQESAHKNVIAKYISIFIPVKENFVISSVSNIFDSNQLLYKNYLLRNN